MPSKPTISEITKQVEHLEGCYADLNEEVAETKQAVTGVISDIDRLRQEMAEQTRWLKNGLGDKIANSVRDGLMKHQHEEWEREREERRLQLEEQRLKNAEIGARKDRAARDQDRRTKIMIAIIPVVSGLLMVGITKLIGG